MTLLSFNHLQVCSMCLKPGQAWGAPPEHLTIIFLKTGGMPLWPYMSAALHAQGDKYQDTSCLAHYAVECTLQAASGELLSSHLKRAWVLLPHELHLLPL